jgi:hypothetical protein
MRTRIFRRLGWILFGLMWIPFIGVFVGMIGFPGGSYSWEELPQLMRVSLIGTGILFCSSMLILFGTIPLAWLGNRRVLRGGQRGEAVILDIWDTGMTINESPVVGFHLEVQPLSGSPFEAKTERLISRLQVHEFQPGARVPVRYNPRSKKVALDL